MAINFEAANMAGYNNPEVQVLRVTINSTGTKVLTAPNFATISNISKSGLLPVLYVTNDSGNSIIVPITSISAEGDYIFSRVFQATPPTSSFSVITIIYLKGSNNIPIIITNL